MTAVTARITEAPLTATPVGERVAVVALVVALHCGVVLAWLAQPQQPSITVSEMSVSIAMQQAEVARPQAQIEPPPSPQPKIERAELPVPKLVVKEAAETAPQPLPIADTPEVAASPAVASAPVADSEPDYKAAYLNNPRPPYPMVARRMGWEGKVVLNVEVLAEGRAGQVLLHQSSGHEVMDNAALQTVKTWRFIPARRLGQPATQWFLVPIKFALEGGEA
jgi:protein TonB